MTDKKKTPGKKSGSAGKKPSESRKGKKAAPNKVTGSKKTVKGKGQVKGKSTGVKKGTQQKKVVKKDDKGKKTTSPKKDLAKTPVKKNKKKIEERDQENALISKEDADISPEALSRGDMPMSVVGHLDELRSRLIVTLLTVLVITLASFFLSEHILGVINKPFLSTGLKLNVFNLTEGFILRLKASLIAAILLGLPVIIFEVWKYIRPAVNINDRKFIIGAIISSIFLFYIGLTFTYFLVLPFAIKMLISFTPEVMANTIGASKYLSFVLLFSLGMGLTFQLPIVVMILTRIGIISPAFLISKRKYAIVLFWVGAAMITPPDVLTQVMLAIPVMILYEISIFISKMVVKRQKKKELKEEQQKS